MEGGRGSERMGSCISVKVFVCSFHCGIDGYFMCLLWRLRLTYILMAKLLFSENSKIYFLPRGSLVSYAVDLHEMSELQG